MSPFDPDQPPRHLDLVEAARRAAILHRAALRRQQTAALAKTGVYLRTLPTRTRHIPETRHH